MAKKSKILMLAPQPFFEPRGTPISVYQRLAALSSLGYQIDVLTYHIGQDVDLKGVTIHRTPPVSFIKQVKIGPSWAKLFLDILLFFVAIRLLIKNRYNVLHSHEEAAFMAMFLAKVFRISHLYDMHSSLPRQLQNFKFGNYRPIIRLFQFLEWRVLHTCDVLITIGADLEQFAKTVNPAVKQMRIENQAIHPDITVELPYSAAELKSQLGLVDKQVVVYTGTFERYQGLDLLLKSAKLVCNQQPDVAFVLVGGKPEQIEVYRKLAYDLGLKDQVHFRGMVSPTEATVYLTMADILVSPRIKGTSVPLKIYSYLHSEKPIVATNLPAHSEVLTEDIALLVEPTTESFAAGILKLAQNKALRHKIGHEAKTFAEAALNPSIYLAKVESIYQILEALNNSVGEEMIISSVSPTSTVDTKKEASRYPSVPRIL
jgi:glycosyltransferase involved in cell wall biosynthesis